MYSGFEGEMHVTPIICEGVPNFPYAQDAESPTFICSLANVGCVVWCVSREVFTVGEAMVCSSRVCIGFGMD